MPTNNAESQRYFKWAARGGRACLLVALVALAACAGNPASLSTPATATAIATDTVPAVTASAVVASPAPPASATAAVAVTGTAAPALTPGPAGSAGNGCPDQQPPASAANRPDASLTAGSGAVSLTIGQLVEVRLAAGMRWTVAPLTPAGVLLPVDHNGWYDPTQQTCVWHYTAQTAGSVTLTYSGRLVCKTGTLCPDFVRAQSFVVTVTG